MANAFVSFSGWCPWCELEIHTKVKIRRQNYRWREVWSLKIDNAVNAVADQTRPHFHDHGYPRKPPPPPRVTLGELTIYLFPLKIQPTVYMKLWTRLGQARQLRGASYLTLAGRVTLADETTFPHANTLSRRPVSRQLEQKMRVHAMTRMFTAIFLLSSGILSNM